MRNNIFKWALRIAIALLLLFVSLFFLLRSPTIQKYLSDKILHSISEKYGAKWSIDKIKIKFFDEIELDGLKFLDLQGDTLIYMGHAHVDLSLFSMLQKKVVIENIKIDNLRSHIYKLENNTIYNYDFLKTDNSNSSKSNGSTLWDIKLKNIEIIKSKILYDDQEIQFTILEKNINIFLDNFDISRNIIHANVLALDHGDFLIETNDQDSPSGNFSMPDIGWDIKVENFGIDNQKVHYKNSKDSFEIQHGELNSRDLTWEKNKLSIGVNSAFLQLSNELDINEMSGIYSISGSDIQGHNVVLRTSNDNLTANSIVFSTDSSFTLNIDKPKFNISPQTLKYLQSYWPESIVPLQNAKLIFDASRANISHSSIEGENLKFSYGDAIDLNGTFKIENYSNTINPNIDARIEGLNVKLNVLKKIIPKFNLPPQFEGYNSISIAAYLNGNMNALNISKSKLTIDKALTCEFSGVVRNVNNYKESFVNLDIATLVIDPSQFSFPELDEITFDSLQHLAFHGKIKGNISDVNIDGNLNSNIGTVTTNITLGMRDDINNMSYKGEMVFSEIELNKLLLQYDIPTISFSSNIDGQGITSENLNSNISGKIDRISYNGYEYKDVLIKAQVSNKSVDANVKVANEWAKVEYDGAIDIINDKVHMNFTADIDTLSLFETHLYDNNVGIKGLIKADITLPMDQGERGYIKVYNFGINNPEKSYTEDSLLVYMSKSSDSTYLTFESDFLNFDGRGQFGLRDLPNAFNSIVTKNNPFSYDTLTEASSKFLTLNGSVSTLNPLDIFLSKREVDLKYSTFEINADFINKEIQGNINVDSFIYNGFVSERINIDINQLGESLAVNGLALNIVYEDDYNFSSISLTNTITEGNINSIFTILDENRSPKLKLSSAWNKRNEGVEITLSDTMIFNHKDWIIDNRNAINIYNDKILVKDLILSDKNESLIISSLDTLGNDYAITSKNFDIGEIAALLTDNSSEMSGNLNGTLTVRSARDNRYYLMDITIDDFIYMSKPVGRITLTANEDPNSALVLAQVNLEGINNNVSGQGQYNLSNRSLDFNADISTLEMRLLDPFVSEIIKDSKGLVSGKATISGYADRPQVKGNFLFQDISTTVVLNNTNYNIGKHNITFDNNIIDIGRFTIKDPVGNLAEISGLIYHENLENFNLDLSLDTENFTFLNTTASNNPILYGHLVLSANTSIKGPPELLDVNVIAKTMAGSNITISPFSESETILQEEYLRYGKPEDFVNNSSEHLLHLARKYPFRINILLDVTSEADLIFIVDPESGDKIESKGVADLRITLDPNGNQEIYGTYNVASGYYSFSYGDFVSKKFLIKPEGTIIFNGNPLNAKLNIDAQYNVYTSTYELIKNEINLTDADINSTKARTNVKVDLYLAGNLQKPEITLDLNIPELQSGTLTSVISRKLNNLRESPSELNKQVFGLLIFNSFIISDNTTSGFENIGSNIALGSISNLISNQLNKIANRVIKGVDVNIDVNSYNSGYLNENSGGNITEIGLKVSKQLFNERLTISAGGNFNLNDDTNISQYTSFIGDFVMEYQLTESGNYRVRVFSKKNYDRLLNENANQSGVSLFFKKSFDSKTGKKNK